MKVTFVLPGVALEPNGGVKIVYEYANRMAARGHTCQVVHPRTWDKLPGIQQQMKARLWPLYIRLRFGGPTPWLKTSSGVRQYLAPNLSPAGFPAGDAVIATFFRTAPFVSALPESCGKKFYLVQHYEDWAGTRAEVDATWRLPMHKIVISKWLQSIASDLGEEANSSHIPNGMDLDALQVNQPIEDRPMRIAMLASTNSFKGTSDGVAVLELVRTAVPGVQVVCFGTSPRSGLVPDWFEYKQLPSQQELLQLYNSASVFLQPSHAEGWGLTSSEAMACGCALVTTDNGGSRDFAIPDETALVVPVGDVKGMAQGVISLLTDNELRLKLADTGRKYVQQFTWSRAVTSLETLIRERMHG